MFGKNTTRLICNSFEEFLEVRQAVTILCKVTMGSQDFGYSCFGCWWRALLFYEDICITARSHRPKPDNSTARVRIPETSDTIYNSATNMNKRKLRLSGQRKSQKQWYSLHRGLNRGLSAATGHRRATLNPESFLPQIQSNNNPYLALIRIGLAGEMILGGFCQP
eukprot:scaffold570882_cov34-Prasinocladus_malaysianus.AAC.1